jgi:type I restriction enzyme S subunit
MVRMNNLQNDGWDLSDLKYIRLPQNELNTYRLNPGDILINRTNSKELVGKCEVFHERGDWVFASYLIRVRLAPGVLPQFVSDFLGTSAGRLQIDRFSRQIIGMTNINAEELRQILIPLPRDERTQSQFVARMDDMRASRKRKLEEADSLLAGLDEFLLGLIGLERPPGDSRKVFAVKRLQVEQERRLNSDFFHPERALMIRSLEKAVAHLDCPRLNDAVFFVRDQIKTPTANYLGLASVQSNTGELVEVDEETTGSCFLFKAGDVLFARLRPYLNKVHQAEMDGCCSPEFHVLRVRDPRTLNPEYLAVVLRSSIILAQTRHMMTGNTHPRLSNDDVIELVIPIPKFEVQEEIAQEVQTRRREARRLRAQAEAEWQEAKRGFEEQLLERVRV